MNYETIDRMLPEIFEPVLFTKISIQKIGRSKASTILYLFDIIAMQVPKTRNFREVLNNSVMYN